MRETVKVHISSNSPVTYLARNPLSALQCAEIFQRITFDLVEEFNNRRKGNEIKLSAKTPKIR